MVEKSGKKRGRKKGKGDKGFWILASLVLDYLLGVMVRVPRFFSDGVLRGLRGVSVMRLLDIGI